MAIDLFLDSINSETTREVYGGAIERFCEWAKIKNLNKTPAKTLQTKLIEYVVQLKNAGKSYSGQNIVISAVKKYCDAYDIDVNFTKVYRYIGKHTIKHKDRPYSKEDIARMLEASAPRDRALVLLLVSTGIRIGAVPEMQIHDLTMTDKGCYKVDVYSSSPNDCHYTFTTPECAKVIDAMLELRKVAGEVLTPNAPLFRKTFTTSKANNPEPLMIDGISKITARLAAKAGLRVPSNNSSVRHTTAINHGFRKLFVTSLTKAGAKPVVVEILTGHNIGLQKNYLRLEESDVLNEYLKAVDLLTVSTEKTLQLEVAKMRTNASDLIMMKASYLELREKVDKLKAEIASREDLPLEFKEQMVKFKNMKKGPLTDIKVAIWQLHNRVASMEGKRNRRASERKRHTLRIGS